MSKKRLQFFLIFCYFYGMVKIEAKNNPVSRPPVVVVVGHIDHGKTTLLDYIRKTNIALKEAGQITQHLGAYEAEIKTKDGKTRKMTFLDTPGHEAFNKLRERGAKVADIAVLVIAADEGVKPQTLEALNTIQKANLTYIVALNKIDKQEANPEKVKKELSKQGIFIEEWGGKIPLIEISAKTGKGVDELLEILVLLGDLLELKAEAEKAAEGIVIEQEVDPQRGTSALLLIRDGTLKRGFFVATETAYGPVRIFENFLHQPINEAGPSAPVRVTGFKGEIEVGSIFREVKTKEEAEKIIAQRKAAEVQKGAAKTAGEKKEIIVIPIILKADFAGSLEALEQEINKLKTEKLNLKIIRKETGDFSKDDLNLALSNPKTIVLGFNVSAEKSANDKLSDAGIKNGFFAIIYEALDWLKKEIKESLPEEIVERPLGRAKILRVFGEKDKKQIVGGVVLEGAIRDKMKFKIRRRENVISEGRASELQQNKMKTGEVVSPNQFGLLAESKTEIVAGDILEFFEEEKKKIEV